MWKFLHPETFLSKNILINFFFCRRKKMKMQKADGAEENGDEDELSALQENNPTDLEEVD